jgi:hypothetical protein
MVGCRWAIAAKERQLIEADRQPLAPVSVLEESIPKLRKNHQYITRGYWCEKPIKVPRFSTSLPT